MLRWIQKWLRPGNRKSAEALSVDADGQPILDSNSEWIVEIEGRPVALLADPKSVEMFWTSYQMTPLTDEPETLFKLTDVEFWRSCESLKVVFRHRASSATTHAIASLSGFAEPGRIVVRGLYPRG